MFGLFKSTPHSDPALGQLERTRGLWRGSIALSGQPEVPLALHGDKTGPDAQALAAAKALKADFPGWRPAIAHALFEHFEPYAAADDDGGTARPHISGPFMVWPHTTLQYVAVVPLAGALTVELGYAVAWDEEHTLGARFQQGQLVELNGSVLRP